MINKRYLALDAFRGLTIAAMILVNLPGSWDYVYSPLRHSAWHGCTPTDFIFPFFLFIVGVAMWFSFDKFNHKASPAVLKKIAKRTLIIFIIGLALKRFPGFAIIRQCGFWAFCSASLWRTVLLRYCACISMRKNYCLFPRAF